MHFRIIIGNADAMTQWGTHYITENVNLG
jgi:hypothetical protein